MMAKKLSAGFLLACFIILVPTYLEASCLNLKGWDFTVAMTQGKLNEALGRVVDARLQHLVWPTFEKSQWESDNPGGLRVRNTVKLEGLKISHLSLVAVEGEQHTGKLHVMFSAGQILVLKEVTFMGHDLTQVDNTIPMDGHTLHFRVKVTAYKLALNNNRGDKYDIKLEIVNGDAIVGDLHFDLGLVSYIGQLRHALSEYVRRALRNGESFNLGSFELPKRNVNEQSLVKDLFPKSIRFIFVYAPHQKSVLAALGTTRYPFTPPQQAFNWRTGELIPLWYSAAVQISGTKFMGSIKPTLVKQLKLRSNDLTVSGCNSLRLTRRINDFKGKTDLKSLSVDIYQDNDLQVNIHLFDHVSPGITADIYAFVILSLTWNHRTKQFDVKRTWENHRTDYHREWWVTALEIVTLGIAYLVTWLITVFADATIYQELRRALNFDPASGGIPTNIGGIMGDIVDNMEIDPPGFYDGNNFAFPFNINWTNVL